MILRALTLAGGIIGAGIAAQGPGFTRAYVFELEAAERRLSQVVADFDRAADSVGMDRKAALVRLRGSALLERRRIDLMRNIERHARLEAELPPLRAAGPFLRSYYLLRAPDAEFIFAVLGLIGGAVLSRFLLWLPTWPARFRRRRALRS